MIPSFTIEPSGSDTTEANLLIEVGAGGFSFIAIDNGDSRCIAMSAYHFPAGTGNDQMASFLKEVITGNKFLHQHFHKINILYSFPTSLLVPHQYMTPSANKDMLELVFGDATESVVLSDFMYRYNLHNVYSIPKQVDAIMVNLFSTASYTHLYSVLPEIIKEDGSHLLTIFNTSHFAVALVNDGKIQAVQTYQYKIPEDASYHLMNLCQGFGVNLSETILHLNGMIDASSNLYNELYKYFLQIRFERLPDKYAYPESIQKYPAHFFSHLFALASCV